jgi:amino acid transporter
LSFQKEAIEACFKALVDSARLINTVGTVQLASFFLRRFFMSAIDVSSSGSYAGNSGVGNEQGAYGLKFRCLSPLEVLAQSVANIAPSACMAAFIPLVFASGGYATWMCFVVATIGLALVGLNVNQFARHSASPGSLYAYTSMGLGPTMGVLAGWGLLLAYLCTAVALGGAAANFILLLCHSPTGAAWPYIAFMASVLVPWFISYRDIRLSAKLMLALEFSSVGLIALLIVLVFAKTGFSVHLPHLKMEGFTPKAFFLGLVLAIFCYVGFESSSALGEEAKNPLRTIPRAIIGSCVIVGLFYIVSSFAEVGVFDMTKQTLDGNADVLKTMAQFGGVAWLGPVLVVMALVSSLGCVLASLNAGSRVLFAMGRHGVFHSSIGGAHKTNETPHIAATVSATLVIAAGLVGMQHFGCAPTDLLNDAGTFATYGFLLGYIFISLAAPMYLMKRKMLTPGAIIISALAVLFMVVPVVGSFYPLPDPPVRYFPYIFMGYMVVGGIWLLIQRARSSGVIQKIEADLEEIGARFGQAKGIVAEARGEAAGDAAAAAAV